MSGRRGTAAGLARYVPALDWLGGYPGRWLRGDLAAGVTTAAVVIPQAMAYATIAGLPVQVGLYVATVPMLVYALLGTSRPLSVSTTSTLAALTAAGVAGDDPSRALVAASTLAALSGALLLGAGVLRLGVMADFISAPVLAGFKAGVGLLIAAGQLGKILGVPRRATASSPGSARPWPTWGRSAGRPSPWPWPASPSCSGCGAGGRGRCPGRCWWSPSASCSPSPPAWPTGGWPLSGPSRPACPSSPFPTWPWWRGWSGRRSASP